MVRLILVHHFGTFEYELALLVLLAFFERLFVLPSNNLHAAVAEYVRDCVHSRRHEPVFSDSDANVRDCVEEVRLSVSAVERLADEFFRRGEVAPAEAARVHLAWSLEELVEQPAHDASEEDTTAFKFPGWYGGDGE